jgi:hypothetical protein
MPDGFQLIAAVSEDRGASVSGSVDPFYRPGHKLPERQAKAGARVWALRRGDRVLVCELRDHGAVYGVEVQLLDGGELRIGRRFETWALAVQWAEVERAAWQADGWTLVTPGVS